MRLFLGFSSIACCLLFSRGEQIEENKEDTEDFRHVWENCRNPKKKNGIFFFCLLNWRIFAL